MTLRSPGWQMPFSTSDVEVAHITFNYNPRARTSPMGIPGSKGNWEILSLAVQPCILERGEKKTEEGQYNGPGGICHILFGDARGKYICIKFYMISLLIDNFFFVCSRCHLRKENVFYSWSEALG